MPSAQQDVSFLQLLQHTSQRARQVLRALQRLATKDLKTTGKFTVPGLLTLKLKKNPTTKAGKRVRFMAKGPADKVVKCFAAAALKKKFPDIKCFAAAALKKKLQASRQTSNA